MANTKDCLIAGLHITISTEDQELLRLLAPRYAVFAHPEATGAPTVLSLSDVSDGTLGPAHSGATEITDFDCSGARCKFFQQEENHEIVLYKTQPIARLLCNADFSNARCWFQGSLQDREFCFNNFLMMLFAFVALRHDTLLFHASVVARGGKGYLFLAESGTGKSTHSALWLKHIPGTELLNDDNPAVGLHDGQMMVYGTPWSGKTPCYRDVSVPVGAMVNICRDSRNHIESLPPFLAFTSHLTACSGLPWDASLNNAKCDTLTALVERVPSYEMYCLPDREAAEVCSKGVGAWDGQSGDFTVNQQSMKPNQIKV